MATRTYDVLTNSNPATLLDSRPNKELALTAALDILDAPKSENKSVLVQQYVNGRPARSYEITAG